MNPTEPNPAETDAIATEINPPNPDNSDQLTPSPLNLGTFLDRLYGTLFLPQVTFEQLKAQPEPTQAAIVIVLVNILETLRLDQGGLFMVIWSAISGLIGWLFFTFLLKQLAGVFQKNVSMAELLSLTGFASLPWLFMAPALSLASPFRLITAIAVMLWFIIWQVRSVSVVFGIKSWKTLAIVPLAIAGGVVALIWLGNTFKLIFSIF